MKYTYHLNSPIGQKFKEKRVEVIAENYSAASKIIETKFPKWQVSMFWPEWKPKKKIELEIPWFVGRLTGI